MIFRIALACLAMCLATSRAASADTGILLLAHGGKPEWNALVTQLAEKAGKQKPTEVAFGMATRAAIQSAIDRLVARGVTEIVAVPLFVSSHSSVITSTEYLLGLRAEAPAALALFAKMSHGHGDHAGHGAGSTDGTTPVKSPVPIRMAPALNDHPVVADILLSRARTMSRQPANEAVILVAHGPVEDEENRRWLADLSSLARRIAAAERFAAIEYLTVRDDAPKPIKEKATAELRGLVEKHTASGKRVLIVPVLISYGGIEQGIRQRLEGLTYDMAATALMPDDRLVDWVLRSAATPVRVVIGKPHAPQSSPHGSGAGATARTPRARRAA